MREGRREECEWENTARANVGFPIVCERGRLIQKWIEQDTIKIKDQTEYTKKVRGALQEQAAHLESLLLDSQCVKKWDQEEAALHN